MYVRMNIRAMLTVESALMCVYLLSFSSELLVSVLSSRYDMCACISLHRELSF